MSMTMGLPRPYQRFDEKLAEPEAEVFLDDEKEIEESESISEEIVSPAHRAYKILKIIGIVISVAAAFVTFINSHEWFLKLRPAYVAFPMALTMVGASVLLPDFGILLIRQRHRAIGSMILASGVLATLFCMVTTTAAFYDTRGERTQNDRIVLADAQGADAERGRLLATRERFLLAINEDDIFIKSTQQKIDAFPPEQTLSAQVQTLQNRLLDYRRDKQSYERQLAAVEGSLQKLPVGRATVDRPDFYSFIGGIFGARSVDVEFFTQVIPAIFLEIVAPVMVAVAMFA